MWEREKTGLTHQLILSPFTYDKALEIGEFKRRFTINGRLITGEFVLEVNTDSVDWTDVYWKQFRGSDADCSGGWWFGESMTGWNNSFHEKISSAATVADWYKIFLKLIFKVSDLCLNKRTISSMLFFSSLFQREQIQIFGLTAYLPTLGNQKSGHFHHCSNPPLPPSHCRPNVLATQNEKKTEADRSCTTLRTEIYERYSYVWFGSINEFLLNLQKKDQEKYWFMT